MSASVASAAEITTNSVGGGPWSDPATWRGKVIPDPKDDVVIQKNDVVVLDRSAECKKLLIDPKGGLMFKTGAGKVTLAVSEGIESFGPIRLDGTRSAKDQFELHLLGETPAKRQIKLGKFGALLLYGKADLSEGRRNVALIAPQPKEEDPKDDIGLVETTASVMVDWQRADVKHIKLVAKNIDNTGAKPNERIKVSECNLTGGARIHLHDCDTPEIVKNVIEYTGKKYLEEPALSMVRCPLCEVRGNAFVGHYLAGINVTVANDSILTGNTFEGCEQGIYGYATVNLMIKQATIRGSPAGIKFDTVSGVLEDVIVEKTMTGYYQQAGTLQLNNCLVKDVDKKGLAYHQDGGFATLLNCNILPAQMKIAPQKPPEKPGPPALTCQQYVLVGVKGAPAGALVEARTSNPAIAAGAADPNVRNSPAPLVDGLTPLPKSFTPLIVKAWSFDYAGKLQPAPEYAVKVLGPALKEGVERPVLKTVGCRPAENGFRANPSDATPTLEVKLP